MIPWVLPLTATSGFCAAVSEAFTSHFPRNRDVDRVRSLRPLLQLQEGQWKFSTASLRTYDEDKKKKPFLTKLATHLHAHDVVESLRGGGYATNPSSKTSFWNDTILRRQLLAELIGTFLIVQVGTGSVMSAIFTDSLVGLFQIASVWIIAVTIAICTTASISGAHLNPAISIAFAAVRPSETFGWRKVIPYSLAQLLGAVLGSCLNLVLYGSLISAFETNNGIVRGTASGLASARAFGEYFASPVSTATAFLAEVMGTGILSFVIFALTNSKNDGVKGGFIPPLIGLTVGALIAVLAPLTQAGFNPARDFGPRIVAWFAGWHLVAFTKCWVYIIGPIIGALLGASVADHLLYPEDSE